MSRSAPVRLLALAAAAVFPVLAARAAEPPPLPPTPKPLKTSCVECHLQLDGPALEAAEKAAADIHFQKGFSCNDCHGGNPAVGFDGDLFAAHDEAKGFIGKPGRLEVPKLCARCHSDAVFMKRYDPHVRVDQYAEYLTSVHGQRVSSGDDRAAVCTDCHGVHGILPHEDSRSAVHAHNVAATCARCHSDAEKMKPYGLSITQYDDYRRSVHAAALHDRGDTAAPTCNDCHGSHGAVPPGVESISNVCGSCHTREATLFRETEEKKNLNLAACIQCMVCHDNHAVLKPTDAMLGVGPESTCTPCHAEGEPTYDAAARMGEAVQTLVHRLEEARELLERAERAGVEVGPDRFELQAAQDKLVEARVLSHSFDLERFMAAADEGIAVAEGGVAAGHRAFAELRFRRIGLALSLVVIGAVMIALTMKIRQIEGRKQP